MYYWTGSFGSKFQYGFFFKKMYTQVSILKGVEKKIVEFFCGIRKRKQHCSSLIKLQTSENPEADLIQSIHNKFVQAMRYTCMFQPL